MDVQKELSLSPGWYIARNTGSCWWNLFVNISGQPPFKCYLSTPHGQIDTEIFPEEIKEVSTRRITLSEYKVLQELQQRN